MWLEQVDHAGTAGFQCVSALLVAFSRVYPEQLQQDSRSPGLQYVGLLAWTPAHSLLSPALQQPSSLVAGSLSLTVLTVLCQRSSLKTLSLSSLLAYNGLWPDLRFSLFLSQSCCLKAGSHSLLSPGLWQPSSLIAGSLSLYPIYPGIWQPLSLIARFLFFFQASDGPRALL